MAAEDCPYCHLIEEKVLRPMIMSREYDDKILLRKINIDDSRSFQDFDGNLITNREFAKRYKVNLTPTVLFLDHTGSEIAPV